jgi:hypothetical protein
MENYLSISHETPDILLIPRFITMFKKAYHWTFTQPEVPNPQNHAIRFNLILPSMPLSPDVLFISVSQSKFVMISELHSLIK